MHEQPTPRQIIATLLPHLRVAAAYACQIQTQIQAQPEKEDMANFFASALSDADLSVQTFVEVAMLGHFPTIRFFGEEYEKTYNTSYFPAITLPEEGNSKDYLVTLDPIDGTRFYLDGHPNFQIILAILNRDHYEAVIAISPAKNHYFYAFRDQGTLQGSLAQDLEDCSALKIPNPAPTILLGFAMQHLAPLLPQFNLIQVATDYSKMELIPNVNGILTGDICGAVLAAGNWIDGGAIAFLAQEAGYIVSDLKGKPLRPLHQCTDQKFAGIAIAANSEIHQQLITALDALNT